MSTSSNLNLALRVSADVTRLMAGMAKGEGGVRKFGRAAKHEMEQLGHFMGSVEGKLAQLGIGVSAVALGVQSARLDKDLKQLQLTAGATADEAGRLRRELMEAQIATGQGADELKAGVDALIAGGLSMAEATATVDPMAETLAVAKTNADALAKAMGVASKQFDIDLSQTEQARLLLDKMVVAGRAGNAELENLPDIFARVGGSARSSNLSLEQTLALVETLSLVEPNAERLATLTDSTLRVFTNSKYMKDAQKATGIKFFDADGSRRDALAVIEEIQGKYSQLGTDQDRFKFISKAFGNTDLDTQRGLKALLDGDSLGKLDEVFAQVSNASGTIARDLPDAIGNAVDQTSRLKGALREAADGFAQPINDTLSGLIKWGLDSKQNGGLGLDGTDIIAGSAAGALGLLGAARYGSKAIKGLAGKLGGTAAGVATGKALEEVAGVTPVYVVNMPDSLGGSLNPVDAIVGKGNGGKLLAGAGRFGLPALAVAGAGATGYGVGTVANAGIDAGLSKLHGEETSLGGLLYDMFNGERDERMEAAGTLAKGTAWVANPLAAAAATLSQQLTEAIMGTKAEPVEVGGKFTVEVLSTLPTKVTQLESDNGLELAVTTGRTGVGR
ncbi:phage tail tape measure protein [Pseudomonas sp. P3C3]